MSAAAGRMASKVGSAASKAAGKATGSGDKKTGVLQKGARRDPELYILLAIMSGAFGLAGWHFGRKPTSSSSEQPVSMAKDSSPWQVMSSKGGDEQRANFKYQYHPGGDPSAQPKEARCEFNLAGGIVFENHANTLTQSNEEVQQSLQDLRIPNKGQPSSSNPQPRNADQICIYKETDGTWSLCTVGEYLPPHKLSIFNIRAGLLRADKGSMNIIDDVINRITIPTEPDEKFVYNSE